MIYEQCFKTWFFGSDTGLIKIAADSGVIIKVAPNQTGGFKRLVVFMEAHS